MNEVVIVPVSMSQCDMGAFVTEAHRLLGRSPTRPLDAFGVVAGPPTSYLASVGEFRRPGINPLTFLRDPASDDALAHLWASFLCACDTESFLDALAAGRHLDVLRAEGPGYVFLLSGNLRQWRGAVAAGQGTEFWRRVVATFARMGLSDVFRAVSLR